MSAANTILNNQQKNSDQKAYKMKPLVQAIEAAYEEKRKKLVAGIGSILNFNENFQRYRRQPSDFKPRIQFGGQVVPRPQRHRSTLL